MYLVQVWATPGLNINKKVTLQGKPKITIKCVEIEPPNFQKIKVTLIEMEGTQKDMNHAPDKNMRYIGRVLTRLSFSLLVPFNVLSARLLPEGASEGQEINEINFLGSPPGIGIFEGRIGFKQHVFFNPNFLSGDLPPETDGAIGWFLAGNNLPNSIQQFICYWTGLEMLAPIVRGPWRCNKCNEDTITCPKCGEPTEGPKTVITIRSYLENYLGVSRNEFNKLYDLRCTISHGGLNINSDGIGEATNKVIRTQGLLLNAIKKSLGWPLEGPPAIEPNGYTIVGVPALLTSCIINSKDHYERPSIYPA